MLELRQNGANRVEISYHTDHQEYEFVGTYLEENLDPKAALALKIKEAQEDLNLRIQYHRNYKDNVAKLEELMERDKEHLNELLKQYEVQ
jgi:polyhydroxyalkanoate synthesis regulator protein